MNAGAYLKDLRKKKGLTIREVVLMTGSEIDKTTISRIERSERKISLKAAYYFSQIYGVPMEEIAMNELGPAKSKIRKVKIVKKKRGRKKGSTVKKNAAPAKKAKKKTAKKKKK